MVPNLNLTHPSPDPSWPVQTLTEVRDKAYAETVHNLLKTAMVKREHYAEQCTSPVNKKQETHPKRKRCR